MSITGKVTTRNNIKGRVTPSKEVQVTSFKLDPATIQLADLMDVDPTELGDGAMLVYDESTGKWKMDPEVKNAKTIINGGHF